MRFFLKRYAFFSFYDCQWRSTASHHQPVAELEKERISLQSNTTANLKRIEEMKKKNTENLTQSRADSVTLIGASVQLEQNRLRLQRRRDRLTALDRKN